MKRYSEAEVREMLPRWREALRRDHDELLEALNAEDWPRASKAATNLKWDASQVDVLAQIMRRETVEA